MPEQTRALFRKHSDSLYKETLNAFITELNRATEGRPLNNLYIFYPYWAFDYFNASIVLAHEDIQLRVRSVICAVKDPLSQTSASAYIMRPPDSTDAAALTRDKRHFRREMIDFIPLEAFC